MKDGAGGPGAVVEKRPQAFGNREDELAHGHVGNDVVHQVSRRLGHAPGVAGRAGTPALAGKRHQEVVPATRASGPCKAVGQDAASQIASELFLHMIRHAVAHGIGLVGQGQVGLQVFPDDAVQRGGLGAAPTIGLGTGAGRWPGWWCGPPGLPVSASGLCGHRQPPASRGAGMGQPLGARPGRSH
jgi:hypothetical protein